MAEFQQFSLNYRWAVETRISAYSLVGHPTATGCLTTTGVRMVTSSSDAVG
jgi:hypothetical protein